MIFYFIWQKIFSVDLKLQSDVLFPLFVLLDKKEQTTAFFWNTLSKRVGLNIYSYSNVTDRRSKQESHKTIISSIFTCVNPKKSNVILEIMKTWNKAHFTLKLQLKEQLFFKAKACEVSLMVSNSVIIILM